MLNRSLHFIASVLRTLDARQGLLLLSVAAILVAASQAPCRAADDAPRFRGDIDQFKAADAAKMPPEGAVLFVGSSSIRKWHPRLEKDFSKREVIGRGFGGSTMEWLLFYFDEVVTPYKPSIIVVYEGDNDLARSDDVETVSKRFDEFVRRVSEQLPEATIAFIPPKPSVARWNRWPIQQKLNDHLKKLAAKNKNIRYIDIATPMLKSAEAPGKPPAKDLFVSDGLHLSDKGYDMWTKIVEETLKEIEPCE